MRRSHRFIPAYWLLTLLLYCPILATAAADDRDPVITHLEFLGYQCDRVEQGIRAKHQSKFPFVLSYAKGGLQLQTGFPGRTDNGQETRRHVVLNEVNARTQVAHVFWTPDGHLFMNAWMPGVYDKTRFTLFLEAWERDSLVLQKVAPDLHPYLKE